MFELAIFHFTTSSNFFLLIAIVERTQVINTWVHGALFNLQLSTLYVSCIKGKTKHFFTCKKKPRWSQVLWHFRSYAFLRNYVLVSKLQSNSPTFNPTPLLLFLSWFSSLPTQLLTSSLSKKLSLCHRDQLTSHSFHLDIYRFY